MGDHSKIEWTDASWNPVRARNLATGGVGHFCIHASEGCRNCYAERLQPRFENPIRFAAQDRDKVEIFLDEKMLTQPLRWKRPRRIFVGSMTDLFADFVTDDMLDRIFAVMALCPQHMFQLLTKRPARMRDYLTINAAAALSACPEARVGRVAMHIAALRGEKVDAPYWDAFWTWPLPNVWLGTSVEDQPNADTRIPLLLDTPAAVRFVSYEPALGPVDFRPWLSENDGCESCDDGGDGPSRCTRRDIPREQQCPRNFAVEVCEEGPADSEGVPEWVGMRRIVLDWIICGGESGPDARPMHPDWARSVRDQCEAAGVPFFFKQHGEWRPIGPLYGDNDEYEAAGPDPDRDVPVDLRGSQWDDGAQPPSGTWMMRRVGKKAAGRLLDGREHNDLPQTETIRSHPAAG